MASDLFAPLTLYVPNLYIDCGVNPKSPITGIPAFIIFEIELINDGGYHYAIYNTIFEHELEPDKHINISKNFKKLMNICF